MAMGSNADDNRNANENCTEAARWNNIMSNMRFFRFISQPRCPKCRVNGDRDVIAAFGVCEACISGDTINTMMSNLLWRRPCCREQDDLPIRILMDYLKNPFGPTGQIPQLRGIATRVVPR